MTTTAGALSALVDALVAEPLDELTAGELQQRIAAVAPQSARLEGWLQTAAGRLAEVTRGQVATPEGGTRSVAGWLAEVQHRTASSAGRELRTSTALRSSLPKVVDAVLDGVLTPEQAAVLARLVGPFGDAELAECQGELVLVAAGRDPAELASWVRHQIATHVEPLLEQEAERARGWRYLQVVREPDGTVRGRFVLAAEDSEGLLTLVEALSRRDGLSDQRTAGQRRADALVEVCEQVLRHGDLPDHGGHRAQVSYVVPAGWAADQAERAACSDCGPRCAAHRAPRLQDTVLAALPDDGKPAVPTAPAEHACATSAWTGPQTRSRIEALLCDARLTRVLLDPAGQVVRLESLNDTVTRSQRRALAARDLGCAARGCTRPPAACDAHHLVERSAGGVTSLDNLVNL